MSEPIIYTGTDNDDDKDVFSKGKTTVKIDASETGDAGSYYTSANTAFFYVTMDDDGGKISSVDVYTGYANAPTVDKATGAISVAENNDKIVAVAFTGSDAAAEAEDHVFVYKTGSTTNEYIEAYVYMNGKDENEIINVADFPGMVDDFDGLVDGLYTYSVNSDGYYELETVPDGAYISGMVQNSPKTTVVVKGEEYKLTDETVVIDNVGNPGTPDAIFNGAVDEGDTVELIYNDSNEILMLVINYYGDDTMEDASASDIEDALEENGTVYVGGKVPAVTVPTDATLVLTGAITECGTITNNGTVVLDDAVIEGNVTLTGEVDVRSAIDVSKGTLDLTGATLKTPENAVANVAAGAVVKFGEVDSSSITNDAFTIGGNAEGGVDIIFNTDVLLTGDLDVYSKDTLYVDAAATLDTDTHTLTLKGDSVVAGTLIVDAAENLVIVGDGATFEDGAVIEAGADLSTVISDIDAAGIYTYDAEKDAWSAE